MQDAYHALNEDSVSRLVLNRFSGLQHLKNNLCGGENKNVIFKT